MNAVVNLFTPVVKGAVGAAVLGIPVWLCYNPFPDGPVYNTEVKIRMCIASIGVGACAGAFRMVVDGARSLIVGAAHIQNRPDTTHPLSLTLFTTAAAGAITAGVMGWHLFRGLCIGQACRGRCEDDLVFAMRDGMLTAGALSVSYRLCAAVAESAGGAEGCATHPLLRTM